ncbi:hypothetical protein EWM64_g7907 [Hericium alpestre]|uniref:SET domain-containing protein n=1 Tax=Hericium alpestre TaxID=135208 RepID=A0A4Y9ZPB3_9AGAM|nr:hypothetical protein EWM64_g7907 [Hericium alpestre]
MKFPILTQPGFLHPVPEPRAPALRVATVEGKRLGLFTTRDIDAGEVIFAERALLIVSSVEWCMTFAGNERGAEFRAHAIRDKEAVMKALVKTLPHEKRAAYRALPNVHPRDECGPLWGVARTNGSGIMPLLLAMVVPDMVEHEQLKFLGVCETLSHLNHSCRPNAALHFDLSSFAFMLHAVRSIPAGTEITGSYTDLLAPTAARQAILATFRFQCTCASCVNSETSDRRRRELAKSPALEQAAMLPWLLNKGNLPDDYLTKPSLRALELLRQEGAEASKAYSMHLSQLCLAYAALGDRERYLDARKRSVGLVQGIRPIKIEGFRDMAPAVPEMHPFWRVRMQAGPRSMQDLQAMLKSD